MNIFQSNKMVHSKTEMISDSPVLDKQKTTWNISMRRGKTFSLNPELLTSTLNYCFAFS